jgi:acetyl esterase
MFKFYSVIVYLVLGIFALKAQTKDLIYKQLDTVQLHLSVQYPDDFKGKKKLPAMIFFFGGGWVSGSKKQFEPQAEHYRKKGFITILADYRTKNSHKTTPFECLKDAKSAIRYVRKNAKTLGIHPKKIIASGGSAGGHLAAACFTNDNINDETDDLKTSSKPNALVLFNPVVDNGKTGYGYDRIGERYVGFSPFHNVKKGFPPTILFLGTKDNLIPVKTLETFKSKIEAVGSRCDLFLYEDAIHGFFNKSPFLEKTLVEADIFLKSLGYF